MKVRKSITLFLTLALAMTTVASFTVHAADVATEDASSSDEALGGGQDRGPGGPGGGDHNPGPGRPDPGPAPRPEPGRPDPGHPEPGRPDPGHPEPGRPDPGHPEPGRPGPGPGHIQHPPIGIHGGRWDGPHWNHPDFVRPIFNFNWGVLASVTCTAEDSQGDLYPVTESEYQGVMYQQVITNIEDAALDECYNESNGDTGCYLVGCDPTY